VQKPQRPVSRTKGLEIDLHRPFVDSIVFQRNGKTFRRTPETIDVWFDSGSMPFAQWHYPFENKETFEKSFPADFIAEGPVKEPITGAKGNRWYDRVSGASGVFERLKASPDTLQAAAAEELLAFFDRSSDDEAR